MGDVGMMGSPGSDVEEVKESLMSPLQERERERFKKKRRRNGKMHAGSVHS